MSNTCSCGSGLKHQDKWWHSYGLYFTIIPRRALQLQGLRIPIGGGVTLTPEPPTFELYSREGKLEDHWRADGWHSMENATVSIDNEWIDIRLAVPMKAQMPLSLYLFCPSTPIIPSYVPNIHSPFPGKHLNDLFAESPPFRILVGRWGGDVRFEIYCQDRRGFRGCLLYTPTTL